MAAARGLIELSQIGFLPEGGRVQHLMRHLETTQL